MGYPRALRLRMSIPINFKMQLFFRSPFLCLILLPSRI